MSKKFVLFTVSTCAIVGHGSNSDTCEELNAFHANISVEHWRETSYFKNILITKPGKFKNTFLRAPILKKSASGCFCDFQFTF